MPENNFDFTSGLLGEKQNAVVIWGFMYYFIEFITLVWFLYWYWTTVQRIKHKDLD